MSAGDPSPITEDGLFMNDAGVYVPLNIIADLMMGVGGPEYPDNSLDLLSDALEDPNYDPECPVYKGIPRWPDGRIAAHEEYLKYDTEKRLVEEMADEMMREVDDEILRTMTEGL